MKNFFIKNSLFLLFLFAAQIIRSMEELPLHEITLAQENKLFITQSALNNLIEHSRVVQDLMEFYGKDLTFPLYFPDLSPEQFFLALNYAESALTLHTLSLQEFSNLLKATDYLAIENDDIYKTLLSKFSHLSPEDINFLKTLPDTIKTGILKKGTWPAQELVLSISAARNITAFALHPHAPILAVGFENTIELWDLTTKKQLAALDKQHLIITALQFDPKGTSIFFTGYDRKTSSFLLNVYLMQWNNFKNINILSNFQTEKGTFPALHISYDGTLIAYYAGLFNYFYIFNLATKNLRKIQDLEKISTIVFHPKKALFAYGTDNGTVALYESFNTFVNSKNWNIHSKLDQLAFSFQKNALFALENNNKVQLWNLANKQIIQDIFQNRVLTSKSINAFALASDEPLLAVGFSDGELEIIDLNSYKTIAHYASLMPDAHLEKIALDAQGKHLIIQYYYDGKTIIKILSPAPFDDIDKALEELFK